MTKASARFEGLLDGYFETLLADYPILATTAGVRAGEGHLGRATPQFLRRRETQRQAALRALDDLSPRDLSREQHLDRLALRALLLGECEDFARQRSALDPRAPQQVLGILLHELQRGDDEPARAAANLRSLLRQTPRYLAEARTQVATPDPVWRQVMEQTLAGADSLLDAVETLLRRAQPQAGDAARLRSARRALAEYGARVRELPLAPPGSFALGAEGLQRRVRDELGLDYTLGQVETLALGEADRIGALLTRECARFGPRRRAEDIIAELRGQWRPKEPLLDLYRAETRRVAAGFRAAKAMTFPQGDELEVRPVPEFLRNLIPTAAYDAPGAFEKRQRGKFWVNDLSVTKTTEAEKWAEIQQHFGLVLTCAHEAYPGHHLQFVTANQHPRRWRRLFAHAVFYEGWTLWCEQMVADLRLDQAPWLRVQQLHDALWRVHRILVDLRLQTRRYSHAQAVRHLQRHLGFTQARARADVNWYTAAPAVPMSYWLGRLENERLHQRLVIGRGWSLRRFNDWLLSFGTLPQAWLEKYGLD
jgi:uncharacterized protein (DUF885 family)